jgi:hypothetical protein
MRLVLASFNNVLGLKGIVSFSKGIPLLIYGDNISGKSNIINLLRYCLIPRLREKRGYAEEKRLNKDEILLEKNSFGTVEIFFEQANKLYRLYYSFSRKGKSVGQLQRISEHAKIELPTDDNEELKVLKELNWKDLDTSSCRSLKEKFVEIGVYPEILDVLISASNVRNFSEAISGSVVRVPEMVAAKISTLHDNSGKYVDNLKKLSGVIAIEKVEYDRKVKGLKLLFEDASKDLPEIKSNDVFITGNISKNLENIQNGLSQDLESMPKKTGDMEKTLTLLSSEKYKLWVAAIDKIIPSLSKKEELKNLLVEDGSLESLQESLEQWKLVFDQLPPESNLENIMTFVVPNYEKVDFSVLSNPERIRSLFTLIEEAKKHMQKVEESCANYKVVPKFTPINDMIKSQEELLKVLKNPSDATGDPALISKRNGKTLVSIPLDLALKKAEYLRGIEPTPLVHKPKQLDETRFKEEIHRVQETVAACITELRTAKNDLSDAGKLLKKTKQIRDSLGGEAEVANKRRVKVKKDLERLIDDWKTCYHHICEVYGFEKREIDLSSPSSVDQAYETISEKYLAAQKMLESDLEDQLKSYPQFIEKYRGQKPIDIVKGVTKEFQKKIEEMTRLQSEYRKVNNWILSNSDQIKSLENRDETAEIIRLGLVIGLELLQRVHEKANVKKIIEELADKIQANVDDVYDKIFPEDATFSFEHLEKGQFLSSINGEPITHPSGSQKVAISMGIMLSLGETFGLPILLDEAFDRVDVNRLRFFTEYITGVAASPNTPQICLAGFTTYNIEKNSDVLNFVSKWRVYQVKRTGAMEKTIELFTGFQDK